MGFAGPDAVRLLGVRKRFGDHVALADLSLSVPRGSIYGVIGPNGSGKTTTLRLLLSLLLPDSGRIEVLGATPARARDRVGYLPEERGLYRRMRVGEVLEYLGRLKGARRPELRVRIRAWLERLGLAEWEGRKVESLSKGMAQKVQLAAALVAEPELLVLDEPLSALDPVSAEEISRAILELRGRGATILLSTHDMAAAERLCDRIAMIFRGRKVLDGTLLEIQTGHGARVACIETDASEDDLCALPGVAAVARNGRFFEVELSGDPEPLLRALVARAGVRHFALRRSSLHEIFVRTAGSAGDA